MRALLVSCWASRRSFGYLPTTSDTCCKGNPQCCDLVPICSLVRRCWSNPPDICHQFETCDYSSASIWIAYYLEGFVGMLCVYLSASLTGFLQGQGRLTGSVSMVHLSIQLQRAHRLLLDTCCRCSTRSLLSKWTTKGKNHSITIHRFGIEYLARRFGSK